MSPPKKRIFDLEDPYESIYSVVGDKPYFGDDATQDQVIQTIENGLREPGKIYLISGPTSTGKSAIIESLGKKLNRQRSGTFRDLSQNTHRNEKQLMNAQVVCLEQDTFPHLKLGTAIEEAQALLRQYPDKSVILETVMEGMPLVGSIRTASDERKERRARHHLEKIVRANPNVVLCETGYSQAQVQEELWHMHETMSEQYSNAAEAIRRTFFGLTKNSDLTALFQAMETKNRKAYDIVFERIKLAERSRAP